MTLVTVVGDCSSTTAVGLAAVWPVVERAVLVEFDTAGGCLAAWLDVPRAPGLSSLVALGSVTLPAIDAAVQRSPGGIEVVVAPSSVKEAAVTVHAANQTVLPVLSAAPAIVFIADGGRVRGGLPPVATHARVTVVVHRQMAASAGAATIGLERIAEVCEVLTRRSVPFVFVMVGDHPYGLDEAAGFVGAQHSVLLPVDPWAAAVFAGRVGSKRRLQRSGLWHGLVELAAVVGVLRRQEDTEFEDARGS